MNGQIEYAITSGKGQLVSYGVATGKKLDEVRSLLFDTGLPTTSWTIITSPCNDDCMTGK